MTCYNQHGIIRRVLLFLLLKRLFSGPANFLFPGRREMMLSLTEALAMSVVVTFARHLPRGCKGPTGIRALGWQRLRRSWQPFRAAALPTPQVDLAGVPHPSRALSTHLSPVGREDAPARSCTSRSLQCRKKPFSQAGLGLVDC